MIARPKPSLSPGASGGAVGKAVSVLVGVREAVINTAILVDIVCYGTIAMAGYIVWRIRRIHPWVPADRPLAAVRI